jgi:hypothetical protein
VKAQDAKFVLTRSYTDATRLTTTASDAASKAVNEAEERKQAAQTEASTLLVDARATVQEAETALNGAPKGKGSKADLDALQSDQCLANGRL